MPEHFQKIWQRLNTLTQNSSLMKEKPVSYTHLDVYKRQRLYNKTGKVVLSKEFTGDYNHVKLCDDQVIMYDGKTCSIFMKNGVQKFKGRMDNNIQEIFPVGGVNQYIVLSANGMEKIRLVK